MAEFPALPLWTDAYLGDTTHLKTFEHGAYLLLIIVSWRSSGCCVADDDAMLARYTRTTLDKWRRVRPILEPFFTIRDGFWHQARLQDEFRLLQSRKAQQSEAGTASAKAKSMKRQERGSTTVGSPLQRNVNGASTTISTPTTRDNSDELSTRKRSKNPVRLALRPDEVDEKVWQDFKILRAKKDAPVTETALAGISREAAKASISLSAALRECCERGWQGFKAEWYLKDHDNGRRSGNGMAGFGERGSRTLGAIADFIGDGQRGRG